MSFQQFWGAMGYLLALMIGVFLVAKKMPHRNHFALRLALCCVAIIAYKFSFDAVLKMLELEPMVRLTIRTTDSFVLYCLSLLSVGICFECDIWAMLFCATAGYCMQHMSQRTYVILLHSFFANLDPYLAAVFLCLITAVYYTVLYQSLIKPADYRGTMLDSREQITLSFIAVLITIFLNSFAMHHAGNLRNVNLYIMLFSTIIAILIFYLEFGWLAAKKAAIESDIVRKMVEADREQYLIEKDIIDLMNIKCHDLKHQIQTLNGTITQQELHSISQTINIYDSIFKTGNRALDITLTRKSLLCDKKGIKLTCVIDGAKLSFLSEGEIYSFFGNILDNAIEAVDKIQEENKRLISLTTRETLTSFIIHEENYLVEIPRFKDGIPLTTKADDYYHGFGTKSIKSICEKYDGTCSMKVEGDIFEVDVVFPLHNQ